MLKHFLWLDDERVNTYIHVRNEHLKKQSFKATPLQITHSYRP